MDSNSRPHHEQRTEHLFGDGDWEKELEEAEQRGYEDGVRAERRREAKEKREHSERKKEVLKLLLLLTGIVFLSYYVYTFVAAHTKLVGDGWFWGCLFAIAGCILEACIGDKRSSEGARGKKVFQSFWWGLKKIWRNIRENDSSFALLVICVGCVIGGAIGKFEFVPRSVSGFKGFGNAWSSYESHQKELNDDGEVGEEPPQTNESTEAEKLEEPTEPEKLDENNDIADFIEKSDYDVEDLRQIEISASELDDTANLSSEDYELVFFTGEEYAIEDWENQGEINDAVLRMIKDLRREKKVNLFDGGIAPQDVQNDINYASEDEEKVKSFMEIERIQRVRADVYRDYPKKSLANLIANSEQLKALVLYYYRGRQRSILYHYGKSILWESEYLKYEDISNDEVSKHLDKIAQRYGDVAFTCKDCTESVRASKLQTAYENAEEWYRGVTDEEDR